VDEDKIFYDYTHSQSSDIRPKRYLTSFAVKRDFFHSFFGSSLDDLDQCPYIATYKMGLLMIGPAIAAAHIYRTPEVSLAANVPRRQQVYQIQESVRNRKNIEAKKTLILPLSHQRLPRDRSRQCEPQHQRLSAINPPLWPMTSLHRPSSDLEWKQARKLSL